MSEQPQYVLCPHEYPAEFAARWDELMDELGEWRRGERTVPGSGVGTTGKGGA